MKALIACSGGPDSMALLDQLYRQGHSLVVAHVNYAKRPSANRDERIVRSYCQERSIPCHVLYPKYPGEGNFQAWARDARYAFFIQIAHQEGIDDLYVAHHLDDSLETYLFQMRRHMRCDHYGLVLETTYHGLRVHRPLLAYEKKELEAYCVGHNVPYGVDETNLADHYTRNQIRHETIDAMTRAQKLALQQEIDQKNAAWEAEKAAGRQRLARQGMAALLADPDAPFYLDLFLAESMKRHLSQSHLESLCRQLQTNCVVDLRDYKLERHDDKVLLAQKTQYPTFLLGDRESVKNFQSLELGNFTYSFNNKGEVKEGVTLTDQDFPLTLRPARGTDRIALRCGTKTLRRFWIDRKIPRLWREQWYVLENSQGHVVFVPGIGCDRTHFSIQSTAFMLQLAR